MGIRQSYPRPTDEKLELVIHGTVYDITTFAKKHPGGSIILEQLNPDKTGFPADASVAYDQLHGHSKKPDMFLKTLKSRKMTVEEKKLYQKMRPYDEQLQKSFDSVTQELKEQGLFEYSMSHALYRQAELFSFMIGCCYFATTHTVLGWWLGALCGGIFMQRSGWFQHECNHGSVSKNHTFNNILGSFWFGFGEAGSASWWKREHNRHHADPQRHGADIDMNTLPLAFDSITAKNGSRMFLSMQHWLYQVGVWGLVHFWQLFIHPKFIIRHNKLLDGSFLILHWALFLGWFVPQIGWTSAFLLHAAASAVEGSLLFTNFALSHTTMPYLENSAREHWVERSLRRTVDVHSHSKKFGSILGPVMDMSVDWIMGYLNYQVVHHLWPLMPQHLQTDPRVHKAVQRICDENPAMKLTYNVTTYDVAMWDMYANLARIARDFGEKKDLHAVHPQKPGVLITAVKCQHYSFDGFPKTFTVAPPNAEMTAKYDLSNVPKIDLAKPLKAIAPPDCSDNAKSSCNWGCVHCLRSTDIVACPDKQDWGPSQYTPKFLDSLDQLAVKISFAVVGSQIVLYPDVLKQEFDRGHHIVSHTWSHRALTSLTNEEIVAELEWTALAIEVVIGYRPKYFRPPFGDLDDRVRAVAAAMGLKPIMWNYDSSDWRYFGMAASDSSNSVSSVATKTVTQNDTTYTMYSQVTVSSSPPVSTIVGLVNDRAKAWKTFDVGVISLEPDLYDMTASFGPPVLKAIMGAGMRVKSVAACMGETEPYIKESEPIPTVSMDFTASSIMKITNTVTPTFSTSGATGDIAERGFWFWVFFMFQQFFGLN